MLRLLPISTQLDAQHWNIYDEYVRTGLHLSKYYDGGYTIGAYEGIYDTQEDALSAARLILDSAEYQNEQRDLCNGLFRV